MQEKKEGPKIPPSLVQENELPFVFDPVKLRASVLGARSHCNYGPYSWSMMMRLLSIRKQREALNIPKMSRVWAAVVTAMIAATDCRAHTSSHAGCKVLCFVSCVGDTVSSEHLDPAEKELCIRP
ncbi:uncharacterized protein A4U43_C08F6190 [Asparagus officinalis]|nr:uncharacterized protein A4U43_C08F6190 [Asparagus officinalis]